MVLAQACAPFDAVMFKGQLSKKTRHFVHGLEMIAKLRATSRLLQTEVDRLLLNEGGRNTLTLERTHTHFNNFSVGQRGQDKQWLLASVRILRLTLRSYSIPKACYNSFPRLRTIEFELPSINLNAVNYANRDIRVADFDYEAIDRATKFLQRFPQRNTPLNLATLPLVTVVNGTCDCYKTDRSYHTFVQYLTLDLLSDPARITARS